MSFNNFINILTDNKCQFKDDMDDENFENDMDKLVKNNKDIVYQQDSSTEFQDNLTFLSDPIEKIETWSYKDLNIRHLNSN